MAAPLRSPPNSQSSSFEHSTASQSSQHEPLSSSEPNSQNLHRETTPSTSLSNPSSQEYMGKKTQLSPSTRGQRIDMQTIQAPIAPMAHAVTDFAGMKRTADGQVKEKSPTSPVAGRYGHSRTSSMTSRGSQIGELSSQLKTRLSYAMVKVQNGWQSHTLTELESLTSAPSSPLRSRPTSSSTLPFPSPTYPHHTPTDPHHHDPSHPTSPTYESFWRQHSDPHSQPHPSLAPPADIHPRRLPHPPRIQTSHATPYASPSTPTTPKPRTPSQNAAMEKDAVETLVFMSSPKNVGYSRGTGLRREVVGREGGGQGIGGRGIVGREGGGREVVRRGMTEREVERVIDGGESSSSSGEEEVLEEGGRGSGTRMRLRGGR